MFFKGAKLTAAATAVLVPLSWLIFGTDVFSYVQSSASAVQSTVKEAVPIEFELQRARDMIDNIIPELQANVRLIAHDEVEIAALREDVDASRQKLTDERARIERLRNVLDNDHPTILLDGRKYSREALTERLARDFQRFKEAEIIVASKLKLLETRDRSLQAAMQMLDRTRGRKVELEQQIEALIAQHRMVQATSVGSRVHFDGSQLSQAEMLLRQIKKRLDIAERVLSHEADFIPDELGMHVDEKELLSEVDQYLDGPTPDVIARTESE